MGIPIGKLYTWMEHGLKVRKNLITERHKYLVDSKDLLEFLQKNQSLFNASKISIYLFNNEPNWLKDKRKEDLLKNSTKNNREWSNEEDKQLISYYELRFTDEKISELLHRSVSAIEHRRGGYFGTNKR